MNTSEITWESWIETGSTRGQYTLHRLSHVPGRENNAPTYVQNIGRTWERACKKADELNASFVEEYEIPGDRFFVEYDISDERGTLREPNDYSDVIIDVEKLWFGKYEHASVEEVAKTDPDYLIYLRDKFFAGNPRMKALIEKITTLDLGESKREREWKEREAKIAAEKKRDADRSDFIGNVGERLVFENMTVFFIADFETNYGITYITGLRDASGNVVIYFGKNIADKGDVLSLRATVKEHNVRVGRDNQYGVKQTIIARPHLLEEK